MTKTAQANELPYSLIVKWNPAQEFEPETIAVHAEILCGGADHVWWGKISPSGRLRITSSDLKPIQDQIQGGRETRLYLYCPDRAKASLHVGKVEHIQKQRPHDNTHIPLYYSTLVYPTTLWFSLSDIRQVSLNCLEHLWYPSGTRYDPVRANAYPLLVTEAPPVSVFDYSQTNGRRWCELQNLHLPGRESPSVVADSVFVLMPFAQKFNDIWEFGIKEGVEKELRLRCERADDLVIAKKGIMEHVKRQISKARILIADLTGNNPNVFYEVGYAEGLNKPILFVAQSRKRILFDLQAMFCIEYTRAADLRPKVLDRLRKALDKPAD